ncbi:MAG TPA: MBL fold metallo-hydrolase [Dehalococcoidia bacterium]|nr:MBL fold metallo-hydrolase [Dehalococcoidia bacterium]
MWVKEPSRINDHIDYLGTYELCFYLVRGRVGMVVGAGMIHAEPALEEQLARLDVDSEVVQYVVVTHSHFDHCGALPYLRSRFPRAKVVGSAAAAQALAKEKVLLYNARMNDEAAEQLGLSGSCLRVQDHLGALAIDMVVGDGDPIDLGDGLVAQFFEVPGHSRCCLATYIPELKALFPTDTMPHPVDAWNDLAYPSAQFDFGQYVSSLKRLNEFDVDILGLDHHGVMMHDQANGYLRNALERTLEFQKFVLDRYAETGDVEQVSREATHLAYEKVRLPFITEELMYLITRAMIKSIVGLK